METSKTQAYLSQNLGDATPSSSPNMGDKSPSVGDTGTPEEEEIVENPFEKKKRKRTSKVWDELRRLCYQMVLRKQNVCIAKVDFL